MSITLVRRVTSALSRSSGLVLWIWTTAAGRLRPLTHQDGMDHCQHGLPLAFAGMCYGVADEVDAAALQGALITLPADALIPHVTFELRSAVFTDHRSPIICARRE